MGKALGADKRLMYDVEMSVCQEGETMPQDFCPLNWHSLAHKLKIRLLSFFLELNYFIPNLFENC